MLLGRVSVSISIIASPLSLPTTQEKGERLRRKMTVDTGCVRSETVHLRVVMIQAREVAYNGHEDIIDRSICPDRTIGF